MKFPGVGRKTALVILGVAFKKAEGIAVDTHVSRLSQRLALTDRKSATGIEEDLMKTISRKDWIAFSHLLIAHGRIVCKALQPNCPICALSELCPPAGKHL
jgi:endonuclease-3